MYREKNRAKSVNRLGATHYSNKNHWGSYEGNEGDEPVPERLHHVITVGVGPGAVLVILEVDDAFI